MTQFSLSADHQPAGSQPDSIQKLTEGIRQALPFQTLLGVTGSGKTFTMANVIEKVQKPTLVLSHNKTLAAQLYGEFMQYFPKNLVEYFISYYDYYQPEAYLPLSGTYIEKEMTINEEIDKLRLRATSSLLSGRQDVIVVASVSCIYGLGNPSNFRSQAVELKPGQRQPMSQLLYRLVDLVYKREDKHPGPGCFSRQGGHFRGLCTVRRLSLSHHLLAGSDRESCFGGGCAGDPYGLGDSLSDQSFFRRKRRNAAHRQGDRGRFGKTTQLFG